jgi:hypothetical protein
MGEFRGAVDCQDSAVAWVPREASVGEVFSICGRRRIIRLLFR